MTKHQFMVVVVAELYGLVWGIAIGAIIFL